MLYIVYFLVITKRRIGKSMFTIRDAINNCDIVALPAEHAELLLKLLPTKDEVADHWYFFLYFSFEFLQGWELRSLPISMHL